MSSKPAGEPRVKEQSVLSEKLLNFYTIIAQKKLHLLQDLKKKKENVITDNGRSTKGVIKTNKRIYNFRFPGFTLIRDKIMQVEKS